MRFTYCRRCDQLAMDPTPDLSDQERDEAEESIRSFSKEALLERDKGTAAAQVDLAPW